MKQVKIDGHVNLVKDLETGAVISTKSGDYEQYIHLRNTKEQESKKLDYVYNELMQLKNEISIIKEMLRSIAYESKWRAIRKYE